MELYWEAVRAERQGIHKKVFYSNIWGSRISVLNRCMARRPARSGDKVFLPISFPAIPQEQELLLTRNSLELPPDDLKEVSPFLALKTTVTEPPGRSTHF
jgi:hypothetical protein